MRGERNSVVEAEGWEGKGQTGDEGKRNGKKRERKRRERMAMML